VDMALPQLKDWSRPRAAPPLSAGAIRVGPSGMIGSLHKWHDGQWRMAPQLPPRVASALTCLPDARRRVVEPAFSVWFSATDRQAVAHLRR